MLRINLQLHKKLYSNSTVYLCARYRKRTFFFAIFLIVKKINHIFAMVDILVLFEHVYDIQDRTL